MRFFILRLKRVRLWNDRLLLYNMLKMHILFLAKNAKNAYHLRESECRITFFYNKKKKNIIKHNKTMITNKFKF